MTIEQFLAELRQPIHIVGSSSLFTGPMPDCFISVNAKHPGAYAAAINGGCGDASRANDWEFVLQPNPDCKQRNRLPQTMQTKIRIAHCILGPKVQPTTYFALAAICWSLEIPCELWGICGWASKYHDGDLEMHHLKRMTGVTVHDPRPQW